MKFDCYMPVSVVSGKGAVRANGGRLRSFGGKCLIVTGGASAKKSGALDDCIAALQAGIIHYEVFSGIEPNPQTRTCYLAGAKARQIGAEFIIGIGGGSPMDAAKAVAIYAANPEMEELAVYKRAVPANALPVVLIGTTAGTGSEVTGVSVLTNSETGKKKSISGADCYAALSFCDYRYTLGVPSAITKSTALDAFAHAAESYLAASANDLSRTYAARAITLLRPFLCGLDSDILPDEAMREALYTASIYAGLAINITGTCFPHTVGYYLTENYGVPHGFACIAFLPALLRRAKKYCPETLGAMESVMGMSAETLISLLSGGVRFSVTVPADEAAKAVYAGQIKNFDRTPGGFTEADAREALASFRADFPC